MDRHGQARTVSRQVRGLGTLVPREDAIRQIPAQTEATVVRILTLPGSIVKPDTILVELNDPTLSQEAIDAELSLKEARADLSNVQVKVQSDLMAQKSAAATVNADYKQAQRQAQIDKTLYSLGVISGLAYSGSQGTADQLSTRNKLQEQTVEINEKAIESQLAVQQAKVAQAQAIYDLKAATTGCAQGARRHCRSADRSAPGCGPARNHRNHAGPGGAAESAESAAEDC